MPKKLFNVTPKPAMLRSIQNERWTNSGALAEIGDNSLGPGRGNADSIWITFDVKDRILTILDDGRGMDAIGRLFQHGNSIGHAIGDIGEYGAGGTKALLWLSSTVQIWTLRGGKVQHDAVTWKKWFAAESFETLNVSDDWAHAGVNNTPAELLALKHGTMIRLNLLGTRKLHPSIVIRDLSRIYSTGLRKGKRITFTTVRGRQILEERTLSDPFVQVSEKAKRISFDITLEYDGKHLPVSGRVTLDGNTPASESRVHIGYGYRVIRSVNECYQSADGEERYVGTGVSGWLDLGEGWQPYLSTTKDAIDDAPLFETLMQYVFEEIKPLLKEAERKSFDIHFEDLALGLEHALNTRDGDIVVKTSVHFGKNDQHEGMQRGDEPAPGPEEWPLPSTPSGESGDIEKKVPPRLNLAIFPTPDIQMQGQLCRAEINGNNIEILANIDHPVVVEAIKSKPINRMALNLMTVGEFAAAVANLDESEHFIKRLFHKNLATTINDISNERDRARAITRQLIDRVRNPINLVVSEAAE